MVASRSKIGWFSLSQQLISRSLDLMRLRNEGYNLTVRAGYLLVAGVPYVNARKEVRHGTLVSKLDLAGDITRRPDSHVAYFAGEYPCREDGSELDQIRHSSSSQTLADGVEIDHMFSAKPKPKNDYDDYYEKVTTYVAIVSGHAQAIDPQATAKTFAPIEPDAADDSVFNYIDSASTRAEIDVVSKKLALGRIAIVGLGGTGSYILDLIAKTPAREIHLFDGDWYFQHNAFRSPGAPSIDELREMPRKVDYLKAVYSKMHRGIIAHDVYVDEANVDELGDMNFVFLCLDRGSAKKLIIEKLEQFGISFVDVGMGIYMHEGSLGGILRITTSTPAQRVEARAGIPFSDGDEHNEYSRNIQVADLNALNATLAVIRWKKLCGFYLDSEQDYQSTYTIDTHLLTEETRPA